MFPSLVVCLLSTITPQTHGVKNIENGILIAPEFQNQEENYIYNPYERNDDDGQDNVENIAIDKGSYSAEDDEEGNSRRLFEWFSRLFQSTTPRVMQTTVTTTEANYQRELKERIFLRSLHRNLTDVLYKLSEVQKQVSFAMAQKESYAILTKSKPQILGLNSALFYRDRVKRDVAKAKEATTTVVAEKSVNNKSVDVANATECNCDNINATNGRRAGSITPTEVKNKLLLYLQESFQEIKSKITSLKNLKQAFSDNVSFKIGYILANIDTLEVSIMNLKNNMDKNKQFWEDNKILELYDTLKVSNQAVTGLIESLKVYLETLSQPSQAKPELS